MKKIIVIICSIYMLSCDEDTHLRKRIISNVKYPDITNVVELDTIYHVGDTLFLNQTQYIIKR